jgi:N-terminal domain of galactosyltransferase/Glycosyl transferase family 2
VLHDWPISMQPEPPEQSRDLQVSFIIGHRGISRLPHLLCTLLSIAAQREVSFECLVVEQSETPEIKSALPDWVRYVHTPLPTVGMPYSRSLAFNMGVRMAKGDLLILHDNDMLVPESYAAEILKRYKQGYELINLKRFIFYLTEAHSTDIFSRRVLLVDRPAEAIVQNLEAGGSIAIGRAAYMSIGGFDESFVGWGGEDNEFWERAQVLTVWPYGYLPVIHLWHPPQAGKHDKANLNLKLFAEKLAIPAVRRAQELAARNFGHVESLSER